MKFSSTNKLQVLTPRPKCQVPPWQSCGATSLSQNVICLWWLNVSIENWYMTTNGDLKHLNCVLSIHILQLWVR